MTDDTFDRPEVAVTSVTIGEQPPIEGFDYQYRVTIRGTGLTPRAAPFVARFGDAEVTGFLTTIEGDGVIGFLEDLPPFNSTLMYGFAGEPLHDSGLMPEAES